jgi:outer membrane protein OmpA-like peptidoglycan-associated protein
MRFAFALCLLLAACAEAQHGTSTSAPPEPLWQESTNGWVYGRSPLHLWPAGHFDPEVVRIPNRIFFDHGSAVLDRNGWYLAGVQAQRLRQLPNHDVSLSCGWSFAEERELGGNGAQVLAAGRCDRILAVYREFGVVHTAIAERFADPSTSEEGEEAQRSILVTAVATGRNSRTYARPEFSFRENPFPRWQSADDAVYDRNFVIFFPDRVFFARDQGDLSANGRSILKLYADAILPSSAYAIFPTCLQADGELGGAIEDAALAHRRCSAIRSFLIQEGLCADRLMVGKRWATVFKEGDTPRQEVSALLVMFDTRLPGPGDEWQFDCPVN